MLSWQKSLVSVLCTLFRVVESAVFIKYTRSVNSFGVSGVTPDVVVWQMS